MEDEVDVYENKFRYIRKFMEFSEPVVFTYKINEEVIVKTTQPLIKMNIIIKNPQEGRIGTTVKLSKLDNEQHGLILFSSNKFKRLMGIDGEVYYSTQVDVMDVRTQIQTPVQNQRSTSTPTATPPQSPHPHSHMDYKNV